MSNLLPIPPESFAAKRIIRMEDVLRRLRQVTRDAGASDRFEAHDASRGGHGTKFSELYTTGEGQWDWQSFYHYYGIHWRSLRYGETESGRGDRGPDWVKFSTEDRLSWGRLLPLMLQALDGLQVSVTVDSSWRWDRQNPRPSRGQPTYIPVYQAMVLLGDSSRPAFNADVTATALLKRHCFADHPLADKHLFDWQEDVFGQLLFRSYGWHRDGFWAQFDRKADLEEACKTMFAGLTHQFERFGKGGDVRWVVTVDLTTSSKDIALAPAVELA